MKSQILSICGAIALAGIPATAVHSSPALHCEVVDGSGWYRDSDDPFSQRPLASPPSLSVFVEDGMLRIVSPQMQRDFSVLRHDKDMIIADSFGQPTWEGETTVARLSVFLDSAAQVMTFTSVWMRSFAEDGEREMHAHVAMYNCSG